MPSLTRINANRDRWGSPKVQAKGDRKSVGVFVPPDHAEAPSFKAAQTWSHAPVRAAEVPEAVDSYLKAEDATDYLEVIQAAESFRARVGLWSSRFGMWGL